MARGTPYPTKHLRLKLSKKRLSLGTIRHDRSECFAKKFEQRMKLIIEDTQINTKCFYSNWNICANSELKGGINAITNRMALSPKAEITLNQWGCLGANSKKKNSC